MNITTNGTLPLLACLVFVAAAIGMAATGARGSKLAEVGVADGRHLMVRYLDGEVFRVDDGTSAHAYGGHESKGRDTLVRYLPSLDVGQLQPGSFTLRAADGGEVEVEAVHRRSKVNGVPWEWPEPPYTLEHVAYLELAEPLTPGTEYAIEFADSLRGDTRQATFTYDPATSVTEAIHVNLSGYDADQTAAKSADLYLWRGDGGPRDYADVEGNAVSLVDAKTGETFEVGKVEFWQPRQKEFANWDVTGSAVWTCDFGDFTRPGTYRLVIDGVGASREFEVRADAMRHPFALSVIGMYYMRIGEPMSEGKTAVFADDMPPPRQPLYMPEGNDAGVPADPQGYRVYLTTMSPDHPEWKNLGGDPWDNKDWSKWKLDGEATNPNAYGGYSDALDWDRRVPSITIPLDLCLAYVLTGGEGLGADDLGIRESGNGTPDLLDSAAYAVDYWRRLRDVDGGFSYGVNNPMPGENVAYQADSAPYMAHANAAMAAMLAECFRLAGDESRMQDYLATAQEAYEIGGEDDLDKRHGAGNNEVLGRDLKATAAAYLYRLTGERKYEDDLVGLIRTGGDVIKKDDSNQVWAYAGYLTCAEDDIRPIHQSELVEEMKRAIVQDAERKHLAKAAQFPSRRASDTEYGWHQGVIEANVLMLAHRLTGREDFLAGLLHEADYSLGRNPLNLVLMTGKPMVGERYIGAIYTSGRDDGFPGVHPGHTPYMNSEPWGNNFMSNPRWIAEKGYPPFGGHGTKAGEEPIGGGWPHAEALWDHPYNYSNNEFTPQQTMAPKTALYGYLHGVLSGR